MMTNMDPIRKNECLEGLRAILDCLNQCYTKTVANGKHNEAIAIQFFINGVYQAYHAVLAEDQEI